jgi:hypothetical protein
VDDDYYIVHNDLVIRVGFKEHKMSCLVLERDGTVGVFYSITSTIDDKFGDNVRPETSPMIASLTKVRRNKVIRLRRQFARGTYDLDERLDAVLERILMDITP